eukprot:CAMPEP_0118933224 /NCGR_PEP_ID=MMETSP1169-20130426/11691_1 /TAXON_ID=36882 /ORGANISM="Pyramimonas obovata, Strain CCMP722" /LENGTH=64 /DNA_ID=CAMNT_0006875961 /DNA_START=265 /DNA_END=459 /DNA_ORIENTATION=-
MENVDIKDEGHEETEGEAGIEKPEPSLPHAPKKTLTRQEKKKRTKRHKDVDEDEEDEDEDEDWA